MITPLEAGAAFTSGCCTLYVKPNVTHLEALRDFETIRKCMERFIDDRARSEEPESATTAPAGESAREFYERLYPWAIRQNPNLR